MYKSEWESTNFRTIGWTEKIVVDIKFLCGEKKRKKEHELFCKVCQSSISVLKGFYSIKQHFESDKHNNNFAQEMDTDQLRISNAENSNAEVKLYSLKDSAFTAELIWCLKVGSGDVSSNFSQDIASVFKAMFPSEGAVREKFFLNPTKIRYLMSDALSPYFRTKLLKDINSSYFTLMFDETTNNVSTKELQTSIRFWSKEKNEVVSHHLETFYMGHATAESLKNNILMALNNADLQLSKDRK